MGNQASIEKNRQVVKESLVMLKRGQEEVDKTSRNAKLVKSKFIDAFNNRDMDVVQRFCAAESQFCFAGANQGMPLDVFMVAVETMYASFPDVCLSYDEIVEVSPGVVEVKGVRSRGTHTGKPFAFGPYPAVPTSNILLEESSHWTIHISHAKMTKFVLDMAEGDVVGPAGYYFKIGGKTQQSLRSLQ